MSTSVPSLAVDHRIDLPPANRSLTSLLAGVEKRTLVWLAERLPAWVNSDHLTALALAAMLLAGGAFWLARFTALALPLVTIFLAVNWFGDSLDGTLARVRNCQRPRYGFYVDHIVDAIGALFLLTGLALSGYMHPFIAIGLLVAYLLLLVETFLATHTIRTFTMSYFKIGPTELRIILAIGTLTLLVHPMAGILGRHYRLFDVGGIVAIVGLLFTLFVAIVRHTTLLYRAEPLPAVESLR